MLSPPGGGIPQILHVNPDTGPEPLDTSGWKGVHAGVFSVSARVTPTPAHARSSGTSQALKAHFHFYLCG